MKIVAINGSPRKAWNTDELVGAAAAGAERGGAETHIYQLSDIDFKGCVSCFGCKDLKSPGRCKYKDGLSPILDDIDSADGLIIGSPIYIGNVTAGVRALIERLFFQYGTYRTDVLTFFKRRIPILMIYTMNAPEDEMKHIGYPELFASYEQALGRVIGDVKTIYATATKQVDDYSKYDWNRMNGAERIARHEEVWPDELKKAEAAGFELTK